MPTTAPSRSTMKLTLTIGMLPLALDVFSAVEDSAVSRSMYCRANDGTLHKVGVTTYDQITGVNVNADQVVKCVQTPEENLVEVTDEEMQQLLSADNGTCRFIGFLKTDTFLRAYSVEKPYQVRPQKTKTKVNPYEKPFALVMESMRRRECVAMMSFVSRGRTRYAAITAEGMMFTVRFDEEVRELRPLPTAEFSDQELSMGGMLIDTFVIPGDVPPVFSDDDSSKIMTFAMEKAKTLAEGGEVKLPNAQTPTDAPGGDLMAMLAASVAAQQ